MYSSERGSIAVKSALFAMLFAIVGLLLAPSAEAQSLYHPYYYSTQEMYHTAEAPVAVPQPYAAYDASASASYARDYRANAQPMPSSYQQGYAVAAPLPSTTSSSTPYDNSSAPVSQYGTSSPSSELPVTTRAGIDVAAEGYSFTDRQHLPGTERYQGIRGGVAGTITEKFGPQDTYFTSLDGNYAWGDIRVSGANAGRKNNESDDAWEGRWLVGRDFNWADQSDAAPYIGVSYGSWFLDTKGKTSTSAPLNQLESRDLTIPVGLTERVRLGSDSLLSLNGEFDYLVRGQTTSYFSKIVAGDPDPSVQAYHGYGARGYLAYEEGNWSFGPFFRYMNTERSASKTYLNSLSHLATTYFNPGTNTLDIGAQLKYHFITF